MVVYGRKGIYSVIARGHGQGFPFVANVLMPVAYVCFTETLYIQNALELSVRSVWWPRFMERWRSGTPLLVVQAGDGAMIAQPPHYCGGRRSG